MVWYGPTLETA